MVCADSNKQHVAQQEKVARMKKTQVVYALIANPQNLFLYEIWASVYSLRLYDKEREVRVCCDAPTAEYIKQCKEFMQLITEVVVVPVPEEYDTKLRSREIKTSVRQHVKGSFLFVDTDTIFADAIDDIDSFDGDIAAVLEYHLALQDSPYRHAVVDRIRSTFDIDMTTANVNWLNSGVMYVSDSEVAYRFYEQWRENWRYSALKKNNSQDMPAMTKTNIDFGGIIKELPGEYNSQVCMSMRYFHKARITHFMHMFFPKDQSFNPFQDKSIYKEMAQEGLSPRIADKIRNVKSIYDTPTTVVGWKTMHFLSSPVEQIFEQIYYDGGIASALLLRVARVLEWIHKHTKKS